MLARGGGARVQRDGEGPWWVRNTWGMRAWSAAGEFRGRGMARVGSARWMG